MTTLYKAPRPNGDSNMIPMINIVFLLLIFFMIAGQIKPTTQSGIEIPAAPLEESAQLSSWRLEMDQHNQLTLNGDSIDLETLQQRLTANREALSEITLIADRRILAVELNRVLELFRQQNQASVTLFTLPQGGF